MLNCFSRSLPTRTAQIQV